jgi:hypothetical protein
MTFPQYPIDLVYNDDGEEENLNYDEGLKEILKFTNHLLFHAKHALKQIAHDTDVTSEQLGKIAPVIVIKDFKDGYPSAATVNKREVWLQGILYRRANMFDELRGRNRAEYWQLEEGRIMKFFLAFALMHEMAHVIVRENLPDKAQQLANTSPVRYNIGYADYKKPESGWFLERMAFGGVIGFLAFKKRQWHSDKKQKVIGLYFETPDGLNLLNNTKILDMWKANHFTAFETCIEERKYKLKPNEMARKQHPHADTVGKKRKFIPYTPKKNEIVIRRKYGECYIRQ